MKESGVVNVSGNQSIKSRIVKSVATFTIVATGVAVGLLVAIEIGLPSYFSAESGIDWSSPEIQNTTTIKPGDSIPMIIASSDSGAKIDISELLGEKETILAFVSSGCEPCTKLIHYLSNSVEFSDAGLQVIYISENPLPLNEAYDLSVFGLDAVSISELEFHVSPTIVGLNKDGIVAFVVCGFGESIDVDYFMSQFTVD